MLPRAGAVPQMVPPRAGAVPFHAGVLPQTMRLPCRPVRLVDPPRAAPFRV